MIVMIWPNKKISVFQFTGLKVLGRVGTHIFFSIFSSGKNINNFIHFERHFISPFKMHKIIFFPENLKKILGFTCKFRKSWVTLNAGIFLFGLYYHSSR